MINRLETTRARPQFNQPIPFPSSLVDQTNIPHLFLKVWNPSVSIRVLLVCIHYMDNVHVEQRKWTIKTHVHRMEVETLSPYTVTIQPPLHITHHQLKSKETFLSLISSHPTSFHLQAVKRPSSPWLLPIKRDSARPTSC